MKSIQLEIESTQISKVDPEGYPGELRLRVTLEEVDPDVVLDTVLETMSEWDLPSVIEKLADLYNYPRILDQIDIDVLRDYVESKTSIYS